VAGTIIAVVPVCCILMDVLVLHEKVTRRQVLCAVGAVGGVALISAGGAVMISALGLLFLLLTMLSDTVYYGISHSAAKVFTPFEMTYVMFLVGMAAFIPAALFQTGGLHSELITVPAQSGQFWLAVMYLGVLSSGVAYGLLNFANSHLTVSESSLFSNVTTVVSVLAGVILLKEPFSLWQILGVAVILVCVFIANVSASSEK
jgi:drug/metabolite transporter (DMT)-like permease